MAVSHLECRECKAQYPLEALYVCERCFGPLEVSYEHSEADRDVGELRRRIQGGPQNIWRYADFLPLAGGPPGPSGRLASRVGLPAGCTPLIRADRLAKRLGLREVWVKNDAANPTHSFKDRVVSVAVTRARELGFETIACASTGNLANSVAAHGQRWGSIPSSSSRPTSRNRRCWRPVSTGPNWSPWRATTTRSTGSAPSSARSATGRS
jgi:threonine synthase